MSQRHPVEMFLYETEDEFRRRMNVGTNRLKVNTVLGPHVTAVRGSGASLAVALNTLSVAVANPGAEVLVEDHFSGTDANHLLLRTIQQIARDTYIDITVGGDVHTPWISTKPRGKEALQYVKR